MIKNKLRKPGIKTRLRACMQKVHLDLFGYEQIVSKAVKHYLLDLSSEHGVPLSKINVRISMDNTHPKATLFKGNLCLREISSQELAVIFMGKTRSIGMDDSLSNSLKGFFIHYANKNQFPLQALVFHIASPSESSPIHVKVFYENKWMEDLSIKYLVQYFKG